MVMEVKMNVERRASNARRRVLGATPPMTIFGPEARVDPVRATAVNWSSTTLGYSRIIYEAISLFCTPAPRCACC